LKSLTEAAAAPDGPRQRDPTMPAKSASIGPPRASSAGSGAAAANVSGGSDLALSCSSTAGTAVCVNAAKLFSTSVSERSRTSADGLVVF
jgi:hypothetical protein